MRFWVLIVVITTLSAPFARAETPQQYDARTIGFDTAATRELGKICFPLLLIGRSPVKRCMGTQRISMPIEALSKLKFQGVSLDVGEAELATCWSPNNVQQVTRYDTPPVANDPANSEQTTLECPARGGNSGTYTLVVRSSSALFMPVEVTRKFCGPDVVTVGDEFDAYVASRLGPPGGVENKDGETATHGEVVAAYYWGDRAATMKVAPIEGQSKDEVRCHQPGQVDWEADIVIGKATREAFDAQQNQLIKQRRANAFERF